MSHDVFISHSAKDHAVANQVCAELEKEGIQCWIAPRDIIPGTGWGEAIVEAIGDSRLMVLVLSSNANTSKPTIKEVERADHRDILVIPFRIEEVAPSKALEFFISTSHWLDAFTPPLEQHLRRLVEIVKRQLARLDVTEHTRKTASISISPPPASVEVGGSFTLRASVQSASGVTLPEREVRWTSSDRSVAAVSAEGVVTAHAAGHVTLTASCEGRSVSAAVTVTLAPVAAVTLSRPPASVSVGRKFRLNATARDASGKALNRVVEWRSSDAAVAAVSRDGSVTALKAGEAVITAAVDGVDGAVQVTVSPALALAERFKAEVAPLAPWLGRLSKWWWTVPAAAAVVLLWTLVGLRPDQTGPDDRRTRSDTTPIAAVAEVAVSDPPSPIEVGDTFTLAATVRDELGNPLNGRRVRWHSNAPEVATVAESTGTVTARKTGSAVIAAESEVKRDSVAVVVRKVAVASVTITTRPQEPIPVGRSIRLGAAVRDARNRPIEGRKVTWVSSNPRVADLDALTAQLTALAPGSAVITAISEARRDSVRIAVGAAPEGPTGGPDSTPVASSPSRVVEAQIRSAVNVCLNALKSNNADRVAQLYRPVTDEDKEKERDLLNLMRRPERRFSAVDAVFAPAQILPGGAHAEFRIKLQWRTSFGGKRERLATFRTEFRPSGDGVQPISCRIVGPADLD